MDTALIMDNNSLGFIEIKRSWFYYYDKFGFIWDRKAI